MCISLDLFSIPLKLGVLCYAGSNLIQVWDMYSGLQQQMFRPERPENNFVINAVAAGIIHGKQVSMYVVAARIGGQSKYCLPGVKSAWRQGVFKGLAVCGYPT